MTMTKPMPLSKHCMATITTENQAKMLQAEPFMEFTLAVIEEFGAQCIGTMVHSFDNDSFTCLFGLKESHISVHTWPELNTVQLDVFLCSYMNDNRQRCQDIFDKLTEYFEPTERNETIVDRA